MVAGYQLVLHSSGNSCIGLLLTSKRAEGRAKKGYARCLKITEKVSFNIASEASYVYNLSGQKLIKNAKNGSFWRVF